MEDILTKFPSKVVSKLESPQKALDEESQLAELAALDVDLLAVAESLNEGLGVADKDGIVRYVNSRLSEILGVPAGELIGRRTYDHYYPPGSAEWRAESQRMARRYLDRMHGKSEIYENEILRGDGERRILETKASPLKNREGEVVGSLGAVTDITDRKKLEAALEEANRKKDDFLAMLAHELRNPMAAISAAASLLSLPNLDPGKASYAREMLKKRVRDLSRLVDDMLDVSRIVRGKIELTKENVEIGAVVEGAVEATRSYFDERHQNLSVEVMNPLPVFGDPTRLEQIVSNLLTNASRYTPEGGTISVRARQEGPYVAIRVRDNGMGMTPEILPKIFDLFVQAENTIQRSRGGLGLGLSIAKKLAEMHGGMISAFSEGAGKGSEFIVAIPVQHVATSVLEPKSLIPTALRRLAILLAEDNQDTAIMTAALLEQDGHSVDVAHDGISALASAQRKDYDVLLLDLGLPGLSGFEVADKLRHSSQTHPLIIAVSGYGQQRDLDRARSSGIDYHLLKPIDYEKLLQILVITSGNISH